MSAEDRPGADSQEIRPAAPKYPAREETNILPAAHEDFCALSGLILGNGVTFAVPWANEKTQGRFQLAFRTAVETIEYLARSNKEPDLPIQVEDVRRWGESEDVEELGAVVGLLSNERFYRFIQPPPTYDDCAPILKRYFVRCMAENPDGRWSDSGYLAAHGLNIWFRSVWRDENLPKTARADLKTWIAEIYRSGDREFRDALLLGALEHMFEDREIREFFSDWKNDPLLSDAYSEACEFGDVPQAVAWWGFFAFVLSGAIKWVRRVF